MGAQQFDEFIGQVQHRARLASRGETEQIAALSSRRWPSGWRAIRVDPETDEVVAVQIVDFLTEALRERPELLVLAELAGIPRETIERSRVPREEYGRAAVRLLRSLAVPA